MNKNYQWDAQTGTNTFGTYSDIETVQPGALMTVDGSQLRRTVDKWLAAPKHEKFY